MREAVPGIVRVKRPRSVVARSVQPVARSEAASLLLPLLVPASLAAAACIGKLFSRKKPLETTAPIAMRVEFFAVVFRSEE
jgi:hypothetical protein